MTDRLRFPNTPIKVHRWDERALENDPVLGPGEQLGAPAYVGPSCAWPRTDLRIVE